MWSLRSCCQWAPVQRPLCSASWTRVNSRKVGDVRPPDYQAAHSTAFWRPGITTQTWVPSADLQAHTLHGTAHGHSVKSLCSLRASHPWGMCVCVCVCPWAQGCWRGRLSCSQMLQDTAPIESPVSVTRGDYEKGFQDCCIYSCPGLWTFIQAKKRKQRSKD